MRSHFVALQLSFRESTSPELSIYTTKTSGKIKLIHQFGGEEECALHSATRKSGTGENCCSCEQ